jgi:hypothetical protein
MERRKSARIRCRFPCEILGPQGRASGTVLDLSEGGLSVRAALEADQGESLLVRFQAPEGEAIEVEALLWHARRVRDRETGEDTRVLGLMVSNACEAYSRVVPRSQAPPPEPASPSVASEPNEVGDGELAGFRIRVRQCAGPRTRILPLSAQSEEEACALAATHLGDDWEVLEILAA